MAESITKIPDFDSEDVPFVFALLLKRALRSNPKLKDDLARICGTAPDTICQWARETTPATPSAGKMCLVLSSIGAWAEFWHLLEHRNDRLLDQIAIAEAALQGARARLNSHPPTIELQEALHRLARLISLAGEIVGETSRAGEQRVPRLAAE